MSIRASLPLLAKKRSNRFIRSGECFVRVHNYPLSYRTTYRRPAPQEELWDEKFKNRENAKLTYGVLKRFNTPAWYHQD